MRQSWRQWIWPGVWLALACVGCDGQLLAAGATQPAGNGRDNVQTAEVVPLRALEPVPDVVRVKVHNGDIDVIAVSASGVFTGAYFVEDNILFFDDITEAVNFAAPTPFPDLLADESRGANGPPALTHVRVPEGAALDLRTPRGNIRVSGKVGAVTAETDNGVIEVRGQTGPLNLTTHGANQGMIVDGVGGPLVLSVESGDIRITIEKSLVRAITGKGSIFFSGELLPGDNYFTTTVGAGITVIVPREAEYSVIARTSGTGIAIQYPNTTNAPVMVCGTMDPGWPVDAHINTNGQKPRGQITLSPGTDPVTSTTVFSGAVTSRYLTFHTTVRLVSAMIPDVSDVYVDTLDYFPAIPGIRDRSDYTVGVTPTLVSAPPRPANAPAPPATSIDDPAMRAQLEEFMKAGGQVPTAAPLDGAPNTAPSAAPAVAAAPANASTANMGVITRGQAFPGHGDNCPLPPQLMRVFPVRVHINSNGGQIRLLQMSPGRP